MTKLNLESYPNPPVTEVAWEIRFNPLITLEMKIEKLQELFETDLPIFRKMEERSWEFDVLKETGLSKIHGYQWEFADSSKKSKIIRFNNRKFSVITRAHNHFSDLLKFIEDSIDKFTSVWEKKELTFNIIRLGLRYINVCRFPEDDNKRFSEWYHTPFNTELFEIENARYLDMLFTEYMNDKQLTTKYRSATVAKKNALVLDFDCFIDSEVKLEDLSKQTSELRDIIRTKFENSITDEYEKTEMRREKSNE